MPNSGGHVHLDPQMAAEDWSRIQALGEAITQLELLDGVGAFPTRPVHFTCCCSRLKVGDILRMLGEEEVNSILTEQGVVETGCEFCGKTYRFDPVDCIQVFKTDHRADIKRHLLTAVFPHL